MKTLQVRLTDEEHAILKTNAYASGLTMTEFIKALLPSTLPTPSTLSSPSSPETPVVPSSEDLG